MIDIIKKVVKNYMSNADLVNMQYGIVVQTSPIQIQLEKLIIPNTKIIVPSSFKKLEISLKRGDKVLLLRQQGGQLFFVLDKV